MTEKPTPGIEILTARLVNELAEKPNTLSNEGISSLDEAGLFERYADSPELPNKRTQLMLQSGNGDNDEVGRKLQEKIAGLKSKKKDLVFKDPKEVKAYLDRFVEGQDDAKKTLAVALVDYLQHGVRSGVLLMGPSGSGKTYMIELLCRQAGIPFVKKSLANVTTEGFKGQNLSEGLEGLLGIEKGILFLDEFDKIATNASGELNGFGQGLQRELLAYFTGEEIKLSGVEPGIPGPSKPKSQTDEEKTKIKAKIYGPSTIGYYEVNDPLIQKTQSYLQQLTQFLQSKGVETEFVDTESAFERVPDEVEKALKRRDFSDRARFYASGGSFEATEDYDDELQLTDRRNNLAFPFLVELNGRLYKSPDKQQLETILKRINSDKPATASVEMAEEDKEVDARKKSKKPTNVIDTSKILIISAGAFHGSKGSQSLYRIIQKRLGGNTCKLNETELLRQVGDNDLIEYGLIPELVGRLQSRVALRPHDIGGLYRILKNNEDSPLDRIKKRFEELGITLNFDDPSLLLLAHYAHEGIGVRGLEKILDGLTKDISFNRVQNVGKTINFTRSSLEKLLRKDVEFVKRDSYEIDWYNIHSIIGYLDLFTPGQKRAKQELATAFHIYNVKINSNENVPFPMANVMLMGPSGSGKTYMIELLAKKAGLPIVATKATGKVPEGFAGSSLSDVFNQFSENQKYGIVYIDEADKILMNPWDKLNEELIGFLENGEVRGRRTDNYLFILSGAFQGLYKAKQAAGDNSPVTKEDLMRIGVKDELLGRIPIIVNVAPPTIDTMVKVLQGPDSVIGQYGNYFASTYGCRLEVDEGALKTIADKALQTNLGFRSLKTVCGDLFREYMLHTTKYINRDTNTLRVRADDARRILGYE